MNHRRGLGPAFSIGNTVRIVSAGFLRGRPSFMSRQKRCRDLKTKRMKQTQKERPSLTRPDWRFGAADFPRNGSAILHCRSGRPVTPLTTFTSAWRCAGNQPCQKDRRDGSAMAVGSSNGE